MRRGFAEGEKGVLAADVERVASQSRGGEHFFAEIVPGEHVEGVGGTPYHRPTGMRDRQDFAVGSDG